jgi:hypothetical protein
MNDVISFVEENIGSFHKRRLQNLTGLKLNQILKRKNPYLFKAKNILSAHGLVSGLLDAHLSSQEETIFGEFLEQLAIFVCEKVYFGKKSAAEGIDLEFVRDGKHYIIAIKSGPNWGNSSQIKKMQENFKKATRILRTSGSDLYIIAINGCCYGHEDQPDKGDYLKLCGQEFWEFISGKANLYIEIIEPVGHKAKEKNEAFDVSYTQILNQFTLEFTLEFCNEGIIDWEKLVRFNSEKSSKLPRTN